VPEKAYYSLLTEFPRRAAMDQSDASSMENFFPSADPHEKDFPPFYYYFLSHFMTRSLLLNIRNCWVSKFNIHFRKNFDYALAFTFTSDFIRSKQFS
jgi:hypothetical protein